jgi:transcriptional regulator with XRE-family HTH domain
MIKMIEPATDAADVLRRSRLSIGVSQSKLARLSRVSRFKINAYELGAGSLTADELHRICGGLQSESDRLRTVSIPIIASSEPKGA